MVAQQGLFLWKVFEQTPFFDQILMDMMIHPELPIRPVVRKLEIAVDQRIRFLSKLEELNVDSSRLFPGVEGLCQSLIRSLEVKVKQVQAQAEGRSRD
jgi:hypothetical protein